MTLPKQAKYSEPQLYLKNAIYNNSFISWDFIKNEGDNTCEMLSTVSGNQMSPKTTINSLSII